MSNISGPFYPGILLILAIFFQACASTKALPVDNTYRSMVVCSHPEAAKAGIEILEAGGNAYDAAIAVQFALAVCYPRAGNIGGGGFLVYRDFDGKSGALDFREVAPVNVTNDIFLDNRGKVIPEMSLTGVYSVGVPGSVDGMWTLHREKGSLPWFQLIEPAIKLADSGILLTSAEAEHYNQFGKVIDSTSRFKTEFGSKQWWPGLAFIQKDLARTLGYIRDAGRDGFYQGKVAEQIIHVMKQHNGILTQYDLNQYRSVWREPVYGHFDNYSIISMPPPSSGGVMLLQMLYGFEKLKLKELKHNTPAYIHGITEITRRVYADRAEYFGDPEFTWIDTEQLTSPQYLEKKYSDIDLTHATPSHEIKPGQVDLIESFETTHFSIVDLKGNAVAVTTTLNGNYGSKLMVKDAGFLLNNEMDDFSISPGVPNQFGLTGGKANEIKPSKRMLSSMTPTIVTTDDRLFAVLGTPGGSTIPTVVMQLLLNSTLHNMPIQNAVTAPKFHSQWQPDELYLEKGKFSEETINALKALGHIVKDVKALGKPDCIKVNPDGTLQGGTDNSKGDGTVSGF